MFNCYVFRDSSMVERTAVNRDVVGSSPTRGAPGIYFKSDVFSGNKYL